MRKIYLILVLVSSLFSYEVINGEAFVLEVPKNAKILKDKKELQKICTPIKCVVIVPVGYRDKIQDIKLTKIIDKKAQDIVLHVKKGKYKKEILKVAKNKVKPPKKELDRIYKEYMEVKKIYANGSEKIYFNTPFDLPLDSKITSDFGNARIFNGTLKSYHSGSDFRAKVGTPIKVVNDGRVVLAKDMYYTGNSVIVDHGGGIFSSYSHLSRVDVKVGDKLKKGDVIGLSGKTGRVTGPHLHFTITINSKKINPIDFIEKINRYYKY
jgi:murein DD-endopeptidase MepM/ murein hydrolase activator NlpD